MTRAALAWLGALLACAACAACGAPPIEPDAAGSRPESSSSTEPGANDRDGAPREHELWPAPDAAPGLVPGTQVTVRETRRVKGIETEKSRMRVRWIDVDEKGRGIRAEVLVVSEERDSGTGLRSTPNEGLRLAIAERSGKLRLLSGAEPHFTDETDRQKALFVRVIASGGWNALKPEEPKRVGDEWSVPLGRYLEEAGVADAPVFEGTVRARRVEDRRAGIAIAFDVKLQTPERFKQDARLELHGEVIFHPRLGIAVSKRSAGELRAENAIHPFEVETILDEIVEGPAAER